LALPGKYTVALEKRDEQGTTELVPPTAFEVEPLNFATLPARDREAVMAFARQTGELQRAALGTLEALNDGLSQVANIKRIIDQTPTLPLKLRQDARGLELKLLDLREQFTGDPTKSKRNEPALVGHHRWTLVDHVGTDRITPQELRDRGCRVRGGPEESPSSPRPRSPRPARDP